MRALVPFTLTFNGNCARFPFIYNGKPVSAIGNHSAPSCLISSRKAGDMIFRLPNKNRDVFFQAQNIPAEKVYSLVQVHSRDVFILGQVKDSADVSGSLPLPDVFAREGDGMVSFSSEAFLAVTVADCLPVFLLDTENGFFAVLHSGWKGTGIVINALKMMQQAGSRAETIAAVLGPCIQSCCYKVDEERAKYFEAELGSGEVCRQDSSLWYLNLQAANTRLLTAAGVRHIAYCTDCTFTDTRLGSYRREGAESYTRMIAMGGVFLS